MNHLLFLQSFLLLKIAFHFDGFTFQMLTLFLFLTILPFFLRNVTLQMLTFSE